jgi:hypothetical protein
MLLPALLNKSASAQYYSTQTNQNVAPLELNSFLHGTSALTAPVHQVMPVLQYAPAEQPRFPVAPQPQSAPAPQTIPLSVAKPSVRKHKALKRTLPTVVKHDLPPLVRRGRLAVKPAGDRQASTHEIQIAQPLAEPPSAPNPRAAVVGATSTMVIAPVPAEVVALAGQIPATPDSAAAGVRIVAADEFTELDRSADEVRIVSADELTDLDLAAGAPVQTNGSNPTQAKPMPTQPAPLATSALRVVMFGLAAPMVAGFLAWPFLNRHREWISHLKYRARRHVWPRLRALRDQCAATAATVWTSIKNASCTRRSIISNVFGG